MSVPQPNDRRSVYFLVEALQRLKVHSRSTLHVNGAWGENLAITERSTSSRLRYPRRSLSTVGGNSLVPSVLMSGRVFHAATESSTRRRHPQVLIVTSSSDVVNVGRRFLI
jgi:hypothetical protein